MEIVILMLVLISIYNLLCYLLSNKKSNKKRQYLITFLFNFVVSVIFFFLPNLLLVFFPFLFAIYLFIISVSNLIMYIMFFRNNSNGKLNYLISFFVYSFIAIPILFSPLKKLNTFIICFSIYIIVLGISYIIDFLKYSLSIKTKNNLKRHIRITMPTIFEAIIPYSVMLEINKTLEERRVYSYINNNDITPNLKVIIHTSSRGVNRMGHMDIYFNNKIYSYGSYDEGSRKFKNIFGDGVLFNCDNISDYINFCIDHSKKTIFIFGLKLTNNQLNKVSCGIEEIMKFAYEWDYKNDKLYVNNNTYAAKLYNKTGAKFYKFKKGKYKTYYVLGTNCCYLVDDIIGKGGIDILSLNGIITPGTYYDYLNKEFFRNKSIVVSKEVYNDVHKASN